jgi:hypothetical protein
VIEPGRLTEQDFRDALKPRHANCNCPLCQMDKSVIETASAVLFAENEKREPASEQRVLSRPSLFLQQLKRRIVGGVGSPTP